MTKTVKFMAVLALLSVCLCLFTACGFFGGSGSSGNNNSDNDTNYSGNNTGNNNNSNGNTQQPSSVTVTLDPNGGSGVSQLVLRGFPGDAMNLPSPTREGYTFDKWYYNSTQLIDTTVFPKQNVTLTARYIANSDTENTIYFQSEPEKEFKRNAFAVTNAGKFYYFNEEDFLSSSYEQNMRFLQENPNTDITINLSLEIKSAVYYTVDITLSGANTSNVIKNEKATFKEYGTYNISSRVKASLVNKTEQNNKGFLILKIEGTLGSQVVYYKNIKASITYTEKAGMMV